MVPALTRSLRRELRPGNRYSVRFGGVVVAEAAAGITKSLALFGDKFPSVFPGGKRELQHAESVPVSNLAVRSSEAEEVVVPSSGPRDDLADSICGIGFATGVLWGKTFVGMFVAGKNQAGVGGAATLYVSRCIRGFIFSIESLGHRVAAATSANCTSFRDFSRLLRQATVGGNSVGSETIPVLL